MPNTEFEIRTIPVTTAAGGGATVTDTMKLRGRLYAVQLVDGDFDDGVDVTITCEQGNLSIPLLAKADFNTDQMVYPRVAAALNTDGSALTQYVEPVVSGELKVVVAQGGNAKSGSFIFYVR